MADDLIMFGAAFVALSGFVTAEWFWSRRERRARAELAAARAAARAHYADVRALPDVQMSWGPSKDGDVHDLIREIVVRLREEQG